MLNLHRGAHLTLFLTRNVRRGADYLLHLLYNNLIHNKGRVIIER